MIADVIHDDTGLPGEASRLLAVSLVGMAQVSARFWISEAAGIDQAAGGGAGQRAGLARHPRLPAHRRPLTAPPTKESHMEVKIGVRTHPASWSSTSRRPPRRSRPPWPRPSTASTPSLTLTDTRGRRIMVPGARHRLRRDRQRVRPARSASAAEPRPHGGGPRHRTRSRGIIDTQSGHPSWARSTTGGSHGLVLRHRDGHHHRAAWASSSPRATVTTSRSGSRSSAASRGVLIGYGLARRHEGHRLAAFFVSIVIAAVLVVIAAGVTGRAKKV